MKTRKIILLAIIAGFSITSCKGEELCRSELSEAKKQSIPYEKGQIISFRNAEGQTIDMTVTESKLDWWISYEGFHSDSYWNQIKTVTLKSTPDNFEISLEINANGCSGGYSLLNIRINNNWGISLISDEKGDLWTDKNTSFHDSIEINGKVYYDVFEQKSYNSIQLFYNKTYGILQINRDEENFLTINPTIAIESVKEETVISTTPNVDELESEATDQKESIEATAIENILKIYPNPNNGIFFLELLTNTEEELKIWITDQRGNLVYESSIKNKCEVRLPNLYRPEVYNVTVDYQNEIFTKKIIVQ